MDAGRPTVSCQSSYWQPYEKVNIGVDALAGSLTEDVPSFCENLAYWASYQKLIKEAGECAEKMEFAEHGAMEFTEHCSTGNNSLTWNCSNPNVTAAGEKRFAQNRWFNYAEIHDPTRFCWEALDNPMWHQHSTDPIPADKFDFNSRSGWVWADWLNAVLLLARTRGFAEAVYNDAGANFTSFRNSLAAYGGAGDSSTTSDMELDLSQLFGGGGMSAGLDVSSLAKDCIEAGQKAKCPPYFKKGPDECTDAVPSHCTKTRDNKCGKHSHLDPPFDHANLYSDSI